METDGVFKTIMTMKETRRTGPTLHISDWGRIVYMQMPHDIVTYFPRRKVALGVNMQNPRVFHADPGDVEKQMSCISIDLA